ncbi:MAG: hypothetical protein AB8C02_12620 [Halioglobus sp.]
MNGWRERRLVYVALLVACLVLGLAAGPLAGIWSFVQVAVLIELTCHLGRQSLRRNRNDVWKYRGH